MLSEFERQFRTRGKSVLGEPLWTDNWFLTITRRSKTLKIVGEIQNELLIEHSNPFKDSEKTLFAVGGKTLRSMTVQNIIAANPFTNKFYCELIGHPN